MTPPLRGVARPRARGEFSGYAGGLRRSRPSSRASTRPRGATASTPRGFLHRGRPTRHRNSSRQPEARRRELCVGRRGREPVPALSADAVRAANPRAVHLVMRLHSASDGRRAGYVSTGPGAARRRRPALGSAANPRPSRSRPSRQEHAPPGPGIFGVVAVRSRCPSATRPAGAHDRRVRAGGDDPGARPRSRLRADGKLAGRWANGRARRARVLPAAPTAA